MDAVTKKPRQADAAIKNIDQTDTSKITFDLSVVTALKPTQIGKRFSLRDGKFEKRPGGAMIRGECERRSFTSLTDFAEFLPTLDARHALMYGLATEGQK